ncbi:uncharacterized protein TRIVIDRAFT_200963 [Trichoderma virens Gv29-8]|uniref:Uncharacterized protein n=1 Tax=Hypocrea virens (strain Gv29-8 / FGSC 10586) TaxID=413071 RepID=G9MRE6_HYPVG|nr:uncharacterized protein TRIVIDRAFT_200963 [Trichoderma virens Gv29-8]EHK22668.1 hypothetical protein TRIVIDRAFT_200963 [Trichoderma virens Gv29-8]UKZ47723.1 hypothetical protein TrVGV298_001949 [Trichoderma virens]
MPVIYQLPTAWLRSKGRAEMNIWNMNQAMMASCRDQGSSSLIAVESYTVTRIRTVSLLWASYCAPHSVLQGVAVAFNCEGRQSCTSTHSYGSSMHWPGPTLNMANAFIVYPASKDSERATASCTLAAGVFCSDPWRRKGHGPAGEIIHPGQPEHGESCNTIDAATELQTDRSLVTQMNPRRMQFTKKHGQGDTTPANCSVGADRQKATNRSKPVEPMSKAELKQNYAALLSASLSATLKILGRH